MYVHVYVSEHKGLTNAHALIVQCMFINIVYQWGSTCSVHVQLLLVIFRILLLYLGYCCDEIRAGSPRATDINTEGALGYL